MNSESSALISDSEHRNVIFPSHYCCLWPSCFIVTICIDPVCFAAGWINHVISGLSGRKWIEWSHVRTFLPPPHCELHFPSLEKLPSISRSVGLAQAVFTKKSMLAVLALKFWVSAGVTGRTRGCAGLDIQPWRTVRFTYSRDASLGDLFS